MKTSTVRSIFIYLYLYIKWIQYKWNKIYNKYIPPYSIYSYSCHFSRWERPEAHITQPMAVREAQSRDCSCCLCVVSVLSWIFWMFVFCIYVLYRIHAWYILPTCIPKNDPKVGFFPVPWIRWEDSGHECEDWQLLGQSSGGHFWKTWAFHASTFFIVCRCLFFEHVFLFNTIFVVFCYHGRSFGSFVFAFVCSHHELGLEKSVAFQPGGASRTEGGRFLSEDQMDIGIGDSPLLLGLFKVLLF